MTDTTPHAPQFGQQTEPFPKQDEAKDLLTGSPVSSRAGTPASVLIEPHPGPHNLAYLSPISAGRHIGFESPYPWTTYEEPPTQRAAPPVRFPFPASYKDDEDDAEGYIARVTMYINIHADKYSLNTEQVYLFLQGCAGPQSLAWASRVGAKSLAERRDKLAQPRYATFQQVTNDFRLRFGAVEKKRTAQAKLEILSQGRKPARDYVLEFEELAKDTGYGNDALVQRFQQGLHSVVRAKIDEMRPTVLDIVDWQHEAIRRDSNYRASMLEQQAWSRRFASSTDNGTHGTPTPTNHRGASNGASVAVSNTNIAPGKLTDAERTRCMREGLCLRCRQKGHMARDCTAYAN